MGNGLRLLMIDLGDSTVVKVEKGIFNPDNWTVGDVNCIRHPFSEVRATIDMLDVSPPVPRIEQVPDDLHEGYRVYKLFSRLGEYDFEHVIPGDRYDALSELAGHPLPIYEPKQGKWTKLVGSEELRKPDGTTLILPDWGLPVEIWRYERG